LDHAKNSVRIEELRIAHESSMFGWVRNSRIATVLGIGITVVHPNANPLFRNSENNCYSAIPWGR
jgi:hypothetical protein